MLKSLGADLRPKRRQVSIKIWFLQRMARKCLSAGCRGSSLNACLISIFASSVPRPIVYNDLMAESTEM